MVLPAMNNDGENAGTFFLPETSQAPVKVVYDQWRWSADCGRWKVFQKQRCRGIRIPCVLMVLTNFKGTVYQITDKGGVCWSLYEQQNNWEGAGADFHGMFCHFTLNVLNPWLRKLYRRGNLVFDAFKFLLSFLYFHRLSGLVRRLPFCWGLGQEIRVRGS